MSHQTTMNGSTNGNRSDDSVRGSTRAVVGNAADVLHDVAELAELQAKLLVADLKSTGRRTIVPTACLTIATCLVPVVLLAVAELLLQFTELSRPIALFLSSGLGLLLAGVFALVGRVKLKNVFRELEGSTTELKQNISWIKQTLKHGGSVNRR